MRSRFTLNGGTTTRRVVDEPSPKKKKNLRTKPQTPETVGYDLPPIPHTTQLHSEELKSPQKQTPKRKVASPLRKSPKAKSQTQTMEEEPQISREDLIVQYNSLADEYAERLEVRESLQTEIDELGDQIYAEYKRQMREEKGINEKQSTKPVPEEEEEQAETEVQE